LLKIVKKMGDFPFGDMCRVYEESNLALARENWPDLPVMQGLYRAELDFYQYLRQDFFTMGDSFYALWEEGRVVSAVRFERWKDGWLLEGLETHPDFRGRGYAGMLLQAVLPGLEGTVYSHVKRGNGASLAVHEKAGFRMGADTAMVDGSFDPEYVTLVRE